MKRIVHVLDDLSPANTGITTAVRELSRAAIAAGWSTEVVSVGQNADWGVPNLQTHAAQIRPGPLAAWRYAPRFEEVLLRAAKGNALIHIHGLWFYPQWRAAHTALRNGWPVIVSPHNMLGGWLWRRGRIRRIKKALYFNTFIRGRLSKCHAIHAVSDDESARIAEFLPGPMRVTVPHALDLSAVDAEISAGGRSTPDTERYVLFLGRIHPVKGLEALVEATARTPGARVIIAGPREDVAHQQFLLERVRALRVEDRVRFIGPVHGPDKWRLVVGAWVLCLPSHSEVLGMVALEAMAASVPVITTPGTGFSDMESAGGTLVEVDPTSISQALTAALGWDADERAHRGAMARAMVESKYSWPKVWPLYEALYKSAAAGLQ